MIEARALEFYRRSFGDPPTLVAVAPGRVNLIGEHVDYADGLVLPMAIERSTAVAVGIAAGERSTIRSESFAGAWEGNLRGGLRPVVGEGAWANYLLGPLVEWIDAGAELPAMRIAVVSDVPAGGGVSSSAALEVATARAIAALTGTECDGLEIARRCQRAEHRFAGTPCGIMDMTVSANASIGHALLIDCRDLTLRHVPMPSDAEVIVFDSGIRHRLSDGGYASRRSAVERAAAALRVPALRDATLEALDAARLDPVTTRRARHVITEIARTAEAAEALTRGELRRFGELMRASHRSLRQDFEVSIEEIDCLVELADAAPSCHGARITGGGFGGCAIAVVERGSAASVVERVAAGFAARFGRVPQSFATGAAAGARVLSAGAVARQSA